MRASRLLAVLSELRRGPSTAARLADELEVSVRTIYRDVAALQEAGIPIWTETGPSGGIRLLDGWKGTIDGLTADEAGALMLSGAPAVAAELGLGSVVAAAQAKVMATLPPELRARAGRVQERFLLDAPGWFDQGDDPEHLGTVADAVWSERRLDIRYGRRDRVVQRRVDPLGLVVKAGTWYLVAAHRGRPRTYRLSRIADARATDVRATRPDGFDLADWWRTSNEEFDRSLLRESICIRIDAIGARVLVQAVGRASAEPALGAADEPDVDGWRELDLRVESLEVAAAQLIGLGAHVEVVTPLELREEMARIGRSVAARHASHVVHWPEGTSTRGDP
jgi:predicted DNA-binding transcriptional regulator YafY